MPDDDAGKVHLSENTFCNMRHGLAALISNNFIAYGQKHKVWVLVFLVRTS